MVCGNHLDRMYGMTVDGYSPLCMCNCEPKPGYFCVQYPREQPQIHCEPVCPPVEDKPGCFWAQRPKNFLIKHYPCKYCPPKCCTRPCCMHIKPKESTCNYDDPCCAACLDHPVGKKTSGRYPPYRWQGPLKETPCVPVPGTMNLYANTFANC